MRLPGQAEEEALQIIALRKRGKGWAIFVETEGLLKRSVYSLDARKNGFDFFLEFAQ